MRILWTVNTLMPSVANKLGYGRGHAFKETQEFIISLSGGFDVIVDDGTNKKKFTLNRSYYGLYIPRGFWREMENFTTNALALEFASTKYDENDYIREYKDFLEYRKFNK